MKRLSLSWNCKRCDSSFDNLLGFVFFSYSPTLFLCVFVVTHIHQILPRYYQGKRRLVLVEIKASFTLYERTIYRWIQFGFEDLIPALNNKLLNYWTSVLLHLSVFLITLLFFFLTQNTKTTCHLLQRGQGAPAREPLLTNEQQKQMMLYYHRRQEELKVRKGLINHHRFGLTAQWRNLLLPTFSETGGGRWRRLPGLAVLRPTVPQETVSGPHQHQMGAAIKDPASVLPTLEVLWLNLWRSSFLALHLGTQAAAVGAAIGEQHEKIMKLFWSNFLLKLYKLMVSVSLLLHGYIKENLKKNSPTAFCNRINQHVDRWSPDTLPSLILNIYLWQVQFLY